MRHLPTFVFALLAFSAGTLWGNLGERDIDIPIVHDAGWFVSDGARHPLPSVIDLSFGGDETRPVVVRAASLRDGIEVRLATGEDGAEYVESFLRLAAHYASDGRHPLTMWGRIQQDGDASVFTMGYQWNSARIFRDQGLDPAAEIRKVANTWRWVKLRDVTTNAGLHTIDMRRSHPGVPHLDMLAFVRGKDLPEGFEARENATATPSQWTLSTLPVRLSGLSRLVSATLEGGEAGGEAPAIEASIDGGQTWRPARELVVPAEGFRLRARYERFPDGARPARFVARVMVNESQAPMLQEGGVSVTFDVPRAGVFRIASPTLGVSFATPTEAMPLFSIELKKRGEPWPDPRKVLQPADGALLESALGNAVMTMTWGFLDNHAIKVTAQARLEGDGRLRWSLDIDNRSEWDVLTYTYPRLAGLRVGTSGYDDRWANTNIYGPWMAAFRPEDRPYPGWGALGWVSLYDGHAGIGFAVNDRLEGSTSFELRPDSASGPDACRLEAVKEHSVISGERREWSYTMLLHAGEWHAMADLYRDDFRQTFGTADHFPDWARDSNGWVNFNAALQRNMQWERLLGALDSGRQFGLNHVQVWGQFGSSSCSSFWWPSPAFGPIEEFARVNREIRNRGGHIGYYLMYDRENRYNQIDDKTFEGYLPQDRYPEGVPILGVERFVEGMRVTDPEGALAGWPQTDDELAAFRARLDALHRDDKRTVWADGSMWKMNPTVESWRQWLVKWTADLYAKQWHCDTAYQDVLGCGHPGRSFDLRRGDHGHIHAGANMEIARQLVEESVARVPSFALSAEGKSELVTRWAMGMTSSRHYGWIYLDTHRYTHPDHIMVLGASNGGYRQMLYNTELAYLYGAQVDLAPWAEVVQTRPIMKLRESFIRYITRADYRDTVGIDVRGADVLARRFERVAGGANAIAVCIVNRAGGGEGEIDVDLSRFGGQPYTAFMLRSTGEAEAAAPLRREGALATFAVPASRASALLLTAQPAPGETLVSRMVASHRAGGIAWRATVANLDGAGRRIDLRVEADGVLENRPVTVGGGEVAAIDGMVPRPDGWQRGGWYRLYDGERLLAEDYLEPLLDDPSFERTGDPLDDAPHGQRAIVLNPGEGYNATHRPLHLAPATGYRFQLMGRRTGTRGQIRATVLLHSIGRDAPRHVNLGFPAGPIGEWTTLEATFETPPGLTSASIYFYNNNSQETVHYDDVQITQIEGQ